MRNIYLILTVLVFLSSCKKESIDLLVTELTTPTTADIQDIVFTDSNNGFTVGGDRFTFGETMSTTDGGLTWTSDTIANNELIGISHPGNGQAYVVGFNGSFFNRNYTADNVWRFRQLEETELLHKVSFYDQNLGIAVGGGSFHTGIIFRFDNSAGITDTLFYPIEHELNDVVFLDQNTIIVVGYGIVLKSTDAGNTWKPRPIDGDYFQAVHFPTPQVGYAVGFTGTIIKSTDGGDSWVKIRNANRLTTGKKEMSDVFFTSADEGYIVGKGGLFWKTSDGGDSWKTIDMPGVNLNEIILLDDVGFIAADEGKIFKFID